MSNDSITVREYSPTDRESVIQLVAAFRVAISSLRGHERKADVSSAAGELQEYIDKMYPIFVAMTPDEACNIGYLVCKFDGDTV